jgi:hypothetical protein
VYYILFYFHIVWKDTDLSLPVIYPAHLTFWNRKFISYYEQLSSDVAFKMENMVAMLILLLSTN